VESLVLMSVESFAADKVPQPSSRRRIIDTEC